MGKLYSKMPVKYRSQGQLETIVEFLKNEMTIIDYEFMEQCMKQFEAYQDNFEVYIQTRSTTSPNRRSRACSRDCVGLALCDRRCALGPA
nr:unnamed protein product [Callosobruchus analis]